MIAVATTSGINARNARPVERQRNTRQRNIRPVSITTQNFETIMNSSLMGNTNTWQSALNQSWNNWSQLEKKDILLRLYEEGALSENDVIYWNMNQIPQITMGG